MKTKWFILILLFLHIPIFGQVSDYALVYIHRLKRSTNSSKNYSIWINERLIGKLRGINTAVSATAADRWLVSKVPETGEVFIRITEGDKEVDMLMITLNKGFSYFIQFDPSVGYGMKSLSQLTVREGCQQVISADKDNFEYAQSDLKPIVKSITIKTMMEMEKQEAAQAAASKPATTVVHDASVSALQTSDVDVNIPSRSKKAENRFALIIGNEDYHSFQTGLSSEVNVDFAKRDAQIFRDYCTGVLGVAEENIIFEINADAVNMARALNKINLLIKNSAGEAEVFVYYAGHGFPDEVTKEPYLIPVNVSGTDLQFAIKLKDFYGKLTEYPSKRVAVFLDACFSGGARNQGLVAARGVKVAPKESALKGNIIVISASSAEQSSLPYKEKFHGMFTYFLLKHLQETKGNTTYDELTKYVSQQVSIKSVMINSKEQNPQTNVSSEIIDSWKTWKIND